jgi:4-carboxymuconolactone decarboxylase
MIGDFAPKLVEYTCKVLFGDVWMGKEISPRDKSLITVAALIAGEHSGQL